MGILFIMLEMESQKTRKESLVLVSQAEKTLWRISSKLPVGVNDRLMSLRLLVGNNKHATLLSF